MPPPFRLILATGLLLLPGIAPAQTLPPPEYRRLAREILAQLVAMNTTQDSGATRAARALSARLSRAGFPAGDIQLAGPRPRKQNLVVRLRGHGREEPILFLAHLDVVDARREDWSVEPFRLTEKDGWLYGRGTIDIKDEAADLIANLIRLRREGYVPERDIIVALTDDEEGGDANGASWLLQHRRDLMHAAYAINLDAGGGQIQNGRRLRNPVQTSEKIYATYRLEITGPGGHSSLPGKDNIIYDLARGLDRLSRYAFPVRLTRTTRGFFARLAEQEGGEVGNDLEALSQGTADSAAIARVSATPMYNSSMRTTCVATMLQAGHAENALPQRAQATVQCRLLPGDSPAAVHDTLARVVGDSAIRVIPEGDAEGSPESPLNPEVMAAVERVTAAMWPGVIVLPVMDPWSSDGAVFRRAGMPVYGVSGVFYDIDDVRSHGRDERVSIQSFEEGVEFMYRLMKALSGAEPARSALVAAESLFALTRDARDRIEVTEAAGAAADRRGTSRGVLLERYDSLRAGLAPRLATVDSAALGPDDARALGVMRLALARDLGPVAPAASSDPKPECRYDPDTVSAVGGLDSLRGRLYACYGWAQSHLVLDGDPLDRLSLIGALGRNPDSSRRRRAFLALEPVWRSVNRDNGPRSPYRRLIALEAARRSGGEPASAEQARGAGVPPDSLESWLLRILQTWRDATADSLVEPWDWYYETGRASRALSPRVPLARLASLSAEVYRALGADVAALRVRYDLAPREGKTPVAFTTFGGRRPIEPWVFATYRTGGLDNLNELLHETGHAVHIAAVRTRPAFTDWPDSDPFTEAVADFVALDVYEPAWQQRWLGDSVPLVEGLRGRYGGIVLDVAWALFEMRMLRDPSADPNEVWTALTRDYLHIRPHPELSWWAMRGQLVDAPGYMMNYAAGAILIAAIRARTRELRGPFLAGDPGWYRWIAPRLFRFGLERATREVVERFLGGPVSPAALLADMGRMSSGPRSACSTC